MRKALTALLTVAILSMGILTLYGFSGREDRSEEVQRISTMLGCAALVFEDGSAGWRDPDTGRFQMSAQCREFVGRYVGSGQAREDIDALSK